MSGVSSSSLNAVVTVPRQSEFSGFLGRLGSGSVETVSSLWNNTTFFLSSYEARRRSLGLIKKRIISTNLLVNELGGEYLQLKRDWEFDAILGLSILQFMAIGAVALNKLEYGALLVSSKTLDWVSYGSDTERSSTRNLDVRVIDVIPELLPQKMQALAKEFQARPYTHQVHAGMTREVRKALNDKGIPDELRPVVKESNVHNQLCVVAIGYRCETSLYCPTPFIDRNDKLKVYRLTDSPKLELQGHQVIEQVPYQTEIIDHEGLVHYFTIPKVRGVVTGSELESGREYFTTKDSEDRTIVMIPANGGYVPAFHGGDYHTGNWLENVIDEEPTIVFDDHGMRHPVYRISSRGLNYKNHGFVKVKDCMGRYAWWPKSRGQFIEDPEKVSFIHCTRLYSFVTSLNRGSRLVGALNTAGAIFQAPNFGDHAAQAGGYLDERMQIREQSTNNTLQIEHIRKLREKLSAEKDRLLEKRSSGLQAEGKQNSQRKSSLTSKEPSALEILKLQLKIAEANAEAQKQRNHASKNELEKEKITLRQMEHVKYLRQRDQSR